MRRKEMIAKSITQSNDAGCIPKANTGNVLRDVLVRNSGKPLKRETMSNEQKSKEFAKDPTGFQERFKEYRRFLELADSLSKEASRGFILTTFDRKIRPQTVRTRLCIRDFRVQGIGMF